MLCPGSGTWALVMVYHQQEDNWTVLNPTSHYWLDLEKVQESEVTKNQDLEI